MTDALKIVSKPVDVATGVRDKAAIAKALADVLADTYRLVFKTHVVHWNVEGPLFHAVHTLTEQQYNALFAATDVLAERIRALGELAPARMQDLMDRSVIGDLRDKPTAARMLEELAQDHERVAHRLHALIRMLADHNDPVTEDLATARSAEHETAAWMLRALSKG